MKTIYLWLSALVLFIITQVIQAEVQKGLLWKIEAEGIAPSYLFATIHSEDPRVIQLPPIVQKQFQHADSVAFEILLDLPTLEQSANAMLLTQGQTLDQLLDKAVYEHIIDAIKPYQLDQSTINQFKPWAVLLILNMPPPKTGDFLDMLLYKQAMSLGIPPYGLEEVDTHLAVFERLSIEEQVILLNNFLRHLAHLPQIFAQLHELYLQGNLTTLMTVSRQLMRAQSPQHQTFIDNFYHQIIVGRNLKMLEPIEERLHSGNAFIAVGALHLPGEQGLLKLLQARGYHVSPVY